ncbi:hypothetical protein OF83DRAFT_1031645, partial [Amylostereum chailletii]
GISTRSLFAFNRRSSIVCHLKDTWRVNLPALEDEGTIIRKLQEANVPHVGDVFLASDVLQNGKTSDTATDTYACSEWAHLNTATTPYRYYRIISKTVGRPLTTFSCSKQLVQAVADAIEAHKHAEAAGYRHHDISVGNILITEDGHGLLIDWDSAVRIADLALNAARKDVVGTWPFKSVTRALNCSAPHLLLDDLESFFWVLLWVAL